MLDSSSPFDRRVERRLNKEYIIWLTTVDSEGRAHPRPVWFLWQELSILIYSRPNTYKISHIQQNSGVVLNFDGDGEGGDIVVIYGQASLPQNVAPADQVEAYVKKYRSGMEHLNMSEAQFAERYSTPIQITPQRVRGH